MDNAIVYYSKAIMSNPTNYLFQRRATCYTFQKNYAMALLDYNRSIVIDPSQAEINYNRGVCYFYVQQKEKACIDWNKAASMGDNKANDLLCKYCTGE